MTAAAFIKACRERLSRATSEWKDADDWLHDHRVGFNLHGGGQNDHNDAKLIAHAPTDLAKLCDMLETAIKEIEDTRKSLEWYANVFAGWEDRPHEFEHFWRVELPHQLGQALAAIEERSGK